MNHFVNTGKTEGSSHSFAYQRDAKGGDVSHYEQVTSETFLNSITSSTLLFEQYWRL